MRRIRFHGLNINLRNVNFCQLSNVLAESPDYQLKSLIGPIRLSFVKIYEKLTNDQSLRRQENLSADCVAKAMLRMTENFYENVSLDECLDFKMLFDKFVANHRPWNFGRSVQSSAKISRF